jgi:hypothetical protein
MTIIISSEEPRCIKAIEIAASAGQWLKCRTRDGQKAFGVPSQCKPGRYYLVTCSSCDCQDFRRNGLSGARLGHSGEHRPCKHVLAVRLYCELAKAQQARPALSRRGHLSVVATAARYDDIFKRFEGE